MTTESKTRKTAPHKSRGGTAPKAQAPDRVWIELERPKNQEHAIRIEQKANNMLSRLNDRKQLTDTFFWDNSRSTWCYGGPMGYTELGDNGKWFNLDYIGRHLENEQ